MKWLLELLGIDPIGKVLGALNKAYSDKLNAKTESERIDAQERIDGLKILASDLADARSKAANYPWWLAVPMAMIAIPVALHTGSIYLGTWLQPIIVGTWLGDWLLHIPGPPKPYDQTGVAVIGFFFGASAALGVGTLVYKGLARR